MRQLYVILLLPLLLLLSSQAWGQFPASCDRNKQCVGDALTMSVTHGKGAQYVDIDTSAIIRSLDSAITFEVWIKPEQQPGMRQFVGGVWGPNRDNNDQWVLYIEDERISFALSPAGSYLGDLDNTVATVNVAGLYTRGWVHVAAVWDGSSTAARIYVDGFEQGRATSTTHPLRQLKQIESQKLLMQIASCNGLYDDTTRYRTFKGQIDEIRLWRRALSANEIRCQRLQSLEGNENGLILYYRCNEGSSAQTLCDATGNGSIGLMRSGAACTASNRTVPAPYIITPSSIDRSLYCTSDTLLTFTITDTSFCGNRVFLAVGGTDADLFTRSVMTLDLKQNVPQTFTLQLQATVIGQINAYLEVSNLNRCGDYVIIPIKFARRTELDYSKGRLRLDTLFVGCQEDTSSEDTLRICNNTGRDMRIDSARLANGRVFTWRPSNPAQTLPFTLRNGTCWSAIVHMNTGDTTKTERDTLRIFSDDRCPGSGVIPIVGQSQEVLGILAEDGYTRMDSMRFEAVCPGQISNVQLYQYRSLVQDQINIDTIIISPGFFGRRNIYPVVLLPNTAYQPNFIRFRPDRPGPFTGQVQFVTHYRGCTIVKTIELTGRGISVDVVFNDLLIGFGNVTIGKTLQQTTTITNRGQDTRKLSAYLKVGDVFTITAGRSYVIAPGVTRPISVQFRPRERVTYYDTLCVFDEECFQTICIPISGTGVFEALSFTPSYINMENVIGCRCRIDTLRVTNISGTPQTVTNARLNDMTGKFRLLSAPVPQGGIAPNQSFTYIFEYCPNDLKDDRADQAFLDLDLANGEKYQVLLRATSVAPKLYVTPLTAFGNVEVGWRRRERILVENASSVPIHVTTANVPAGYTVISTTPALPVMLDPRDSLWVDVELAPTAETNYNGNLTLGSDDPCALSWSGALTGKGVILRLDVPISFINYSLIKPCDCAVREIPMPNLSQYIPMSIDSIWIDGAGVPSPRPAVFSWRSRQTGGSTLPYTIAPLTTDTLLVSFCPNIPATQQNVLSNAVIHITASTGAWNQTFATTLSGRRELNFQPNRILVQFPATRVDTAATAIPVDITVPDAFQNPSGDSVIITGASFVPDQRVFSISTNPAVPFPWVIRRGETFRFFVNFYPRAPKDYTARLRLHTSFPCEGADTTILVKGTGFAPAFGLQMAFDTAAVGQDTFHLTTCDTLLLPVMINRGIPQSIIDMAFRIGYDSTALRLLDITSPYTTNVTLSDTGDGARAYLKDARDAGAGVVAWIRFVVRGGATQFPIFLDEIEFDSDSLVFFNIIAGVDQGWVEIDEPMIAVSPVTAFDTVNLKSCADRIVYVWNPGAIPIRFDSLGGLPLGHRITASSVPYPTMIAPGDSIALTVTFCPWIENSYSSTLYSQSNEPCPISDSGAISSFGYAPPFPVRLLLHPDPNAQLMLGGTIADTVELPLYVDRDVPQTPLDVNMTLQYNRRALQFIGISSSYAPGATANSFAGGLQISLPHCDSLKAGEIARLKFIVSVPDSISSPIYLVPEKFTSDSVFWVKLDPPITTGDSGIVRVDPKCNISRLNFRGGTNKLMAPVPNPSTSRVAIEAEFIEDSRARLRLFNSAGIEVVSLLDGSEILSGGRYRFEFDVSGLPSGDYFCVLEANRFRASERVQVVK